jgi:ABC-type glycerol-3-phosphate transport system substrate-binding protein
MLKKITCILLVAFVFLTACVTKNNKNQTKEKSIPTIAETHQTNNISMVDFTGVPHIKSWVSQFNGNHSEIDIEFVSKTDDEEDFWNAIMAELALGKGPDLFCMWAGDERILALNYKGVLANLDDYVPLEIKKNIFSGIIQSGTIDQKWVGLGVEGMPQILIVSDALWGKDRWSLEDIVSISKEHTDMEGLFVNLDFTYNGEGDPLKNAEYLFDNPDIFVDINQKSPKFENQSFIDALELIKGYAPISIRKNEIVDCLQKYTWILEQQKTIRRNDC